MKVIVISDTHYPINSSALSEKMYKIFESADLILHCGDLIDMEIIDSIRKKCPSVKIKAVKGNMDTPKVKKIFPEKEILQLGKFKIGLAHGWGHPDNIINVLKKIFEGEKLDAIVFGHTHRPFNKQIDGILYFNPGSLCDKIFAPYNSYGILEIGDTLKGRIIRIT